MVVSNTLFERLAASDRSLPKSQMVDPDVLRRSILRNLNRLLNTRQGSSEAQPDLGVPPPYELLVDYPASAGRILAAIAACIERYEPRLSDVRVHHLPHEDYDLELRFRVTARIPALGNEVVGLETMVKRNGRFECRNYS